MARTLGQVPRSPIAPDHAGRFETLLLWALRPELVDTGRLPDASAFPVSEGDDPFGADRHRPDHPLHGNFGPDPRDLDLEDAATLLEHLVPWVTTLVRPEQPGAGPQ